MKVVIDTNVFVGACLGQGASAEVIEACLVGRCVPVVGSALLAEYEDILGRKALFKRSRLNDDERRELLDIFLSACQWTRIYYGWRPNLRDEGDNHLIELADAGGARFVVTRNLRDLTAMEMKFTGLEIASPETLLKELKPWPH